MKVFVLLPSHQGIDRWQQRAWQQEMPDHTPYGYHHAASPDVQIEFSSATEMGLLARLSKRLLRLNVVHAWRHRRAIYASDVVWTHTEHEHLALLLLFRLLGPLRRPPRLIAQCIWLFDDWQRLPRLGRWLCSVLLRGADVLTVHSRCNQRLARELVPGARVELMPFGISLEVFPLTRRPVWQPSTPLRVLAVGNDRDRDWPLLLATVAGNPAFELVVASSSCPEPTTGSLHRETPDVQRLKQLYAWADVVVVPLRENSHASGLTVVLEAVAMGVPVVCADTGGLRDYFPDHAITFYTPGAGAELLYALEALYAAPEAVARCVEVAQQRLLDMGYTSRDWASRHVQLSLAIGAAPATRGLQCPSAV